MSLTNSLPLNPCSRGSRERKPRWRSMKYFVGTQQRQDLLLGAIPCLQCLLFSTLLSQLSGLSVHSTHHACASRPLHFFFVVVFVRGTPQPQVSSDVFLTNQTKGPTHASRSTTVLQIYISLCRICGYVWIYCSALDHWGSTLR